MTESSKLWTPNTQDGATSPEDIALMQRVLSAAAKNPSQIPSDFMSYALDYMQANRLTIPIGQITGFSQFQVHTFQDSSSIVQITTTGANSDMPDGPVQFPLPLPKGRYIVFFGAQLRILYGSNSDALIVRCMGNVTSITPPSITTTGANNIVNMDCIMQSFWDGGHPITDDLAITTMAYTLCDVSLDANQFRLLAWLLNGTRTCYVGQRWMAAIKYANL